MPSRVLLILALLALVVVFPVSAPEGRETTAAARQSAISPAQSPGEHDRLRADMEGQVERLKLNVEKVMEVQEKRIGDLTYFGNFNNGLITFMGALVTALVVFMAFKSKEDARAAVREWLDKEAKAELTKEFEAFRLKVERQAAATLAQLSIDMDKKLEQRAEERFASIDEKASTFIARLEKGSALVESMEAFWDARETTRPASESAGSLSDMVSDPVKLQAAVKEASAVPEGERTFNDWCVLAVAAVEGKDDPAALDYFAKARAAGTVNRRLALEVNYHATRAAQRLERWDEAVKLADATLAQWLHGGVQGVDVMVANSYFRKCWAFMKMEKYQEALDVADAALAAPLNLDNPNAAKAIESIRFKRGFALASLGRDSEAEVAYDDFINRRGDGDGGSLKIDFASALLNKMLLRRKQKDRVAQRRLIEEMEARFGSLQNDERISGILAKAKRFWPEVQALVVEDGV